jgi:hypothetical protein
MGNGTSFCTTECERHVEINANAKKPKDYPGGGWTCRQPMEVTRKNVHNYSHDFTEADISDCLWGGHL